MAKKTKDEPSSNINEQLDKELSNLGFAGIVELAENMTDMSVTCVSTGFPQLDKILHKDLNGLPLGRDIEIYSKEAEVGKTSLALEFVKSFQSQGLRTAIIDVERTITLDYLHSCGVITDTNDDNVCAVRIIKPEEALSGEEILNLVKAVSNTFDLIVVDSLAAMDLQANLEKGSDDANKVGGISLLMSEYFKKNMRKRACVVWINQTRQSIGYNPTGGVRYTSCGGRAMLFYGSIRMELSIVEKIKGSTDDDIVGYQVKVFTSKNKVSPQWKSAILTYIFGETFSTTYDWFSLALKNNVVEKKGGWFQFGDIKIQGAMKFYARMKNDPELFKAIKDALTGQDSLEEKSSGEEVS